MTTRRPTAHHYGSPMISDLGEITAAFRSSAPISAVNYHNTPAYRADQYDHELAALAERFAPTTEDDLAEYFRTGHWPGGKPGIIVALYNGYRNNYDVFRPLLDKHGLVGWFFAPSAYAGCPPEEQAAFADQHRLRTIANEYADGRYAMNWEELRDLDKRHVVASHTRNHARISTDDAAAMESEIVGAQEDFCRHLGHRVRSFAWLLSGTYGQSPVTDACVDRAEYEFLFSNFKIQRLPLRASAHR